MPVAPVVLASDARQQPQLHGGEQAVRNRDPQHRRMFLKIEAVLQAQRPELVFGQITREETLRLVAKLRDAPRDEIDVEFIVTVQGVWLRI